MSDPEITDIKYLNHELEKVRSQFNIFYKLTKIMRTTLHLEEAAYIILTGLTAHQGLGFNRAFLFLQDKITGVLKGFLGIGPVDGSEAQNIWNLIEAQKMDLYGLIYNFRGIKDGTVRSGLMDLTRSLAVPIAEGGLVYDTLRSAHPFIVSGETMREKYAGDPITAKLKLNSFAAASLTSSSGSLGIIIVDNLVTGKPISEEDLRIFSMYVDQASGAIENCQEYERTLFKAHTDSLTSLWNHGFFQWRLEEEIAKSSKENKPLSVIMADIDHFKKFNDTFGHQRGDEAIQIIARTLKFCARETDIPCRYGGEEFSIIMPGTNPEEAEAAAERLRNSVEQLNIDGASLSFSIGTASFPRDAGTKQDLIRKADSALYRAKSGGRNRVVSA